VPDDALHRLRERAQQLRIVEPRDEKVVHVEKQPESIALFPQLLLKALRFFEKRGNC